MSTPSTTTVAPSDHPLLQNLNTPHRILSQLEPNNDLVLFRNDFCCFACSKPFVTGQDSIEGWGILCLHTMMAFTCPACTTMEKDIWRGDPDHPVSVWTFDDFQAKHPTVTLEVFYALQAARYIGGKGTIRGQTVRNATEYTIFRNRGPDAIPAGDDIYVDLGAPVGTSLNAYSRRPPSSTVPSSASE
jgi:hypothetical protein